MAGVENGPKRFDELPLEAGDIVVDRDDASPNEAVVVHQETLGRVSPNYAGGYPIPIERLHADAVNYYSFRHSGFERAGFETRQKFHFRKSIPLRIMHGTLANQRAGRISKPSESRDDRNSFR